MIDLPVSDSRKTQVNLDMQRSLCSSVCLCDADAQNHRCLELVDSDCILIKRSGIRLIYTNNHTIDS